jgi:large subunit ribosomal protein L29
MNKNMKELGQKTPVELETALRDKSRLLLDMRLKKRSGQIEKPHLFCTLRRDIARIRTLLASK